MRTHSHSLPTAPVTVTEHGDGAPVLLLHGGAGPATVRAFAARLGAALPARVIAPVHPGFDGTPRPGALRTIPELARLYAELLEELDLTGVTVIGNSIGGWITAEMAVLNLPRVSRYVLLDAVGIEAPGHPLVDFFSLSPAEVAAHAFHDPARFAVDPSTLPPAAQQAMAGNQETLAVYAAAGMTDPSLAGRLGAIAAPTLVVWGESDRIADPELGRAYAAAIPGAEFVLLPETGHMPQLESPERLLEAVSTFIAQPARQ